jgi:aspartate/methionine/tyrosine aminotransferase
MDFQNFELETFQSLYERTVDYNLADSSVQCAHVHQLLDGDVTSLVDLPLYYPEVNGTALLRERIAVQYPKATPSNVLVTVGASQANNLICNTLLEPGDEVIVFTPCYQQVWGLARNLGCRVRELQLRPEDDWRPDLDQLEKLAGTKTRLIALVNPNNPTGSVLSEEEMRRIVAVCERTGAWLHADEVYRGTERGGPESPTFWGMYDKTVCVNSLSKAYGLAGLRIGWALAMPDVIEDLWRRHEYTVIAGAGPSMKLAEIALKPAKRSTLLERQRGLSNDGHKILSAWLAEQNGRFSCKTPPATSIAFVRSHLEMPSLDLANHLRKKASVLVAPGAYLGTENHLRIAIGYDAGRLQAALGRISEATTELAPDAGSQRVEQAFMPAAEAK